MKLASIKRKNLRNFLWTAPLMHICVCLPFRFIHDKDSFDRGCLCAVTSGGHYEMTHLNSSWIPRHVNVKIPLPHALRQIHTNIQNISCVAISSCALAQENRVPRLKPNAHEPRRTVSRAWASTTASPWSKTMLVVGGSLVFISCEALI